MSKDAIIIRTSWLYFIYENNFVDTILRLGKERDELNIVNENIIKSQSNNNQLVAAATSN